jgi:toxin ParE1/3/4
MTIILHPDAEEELAKIIESLDEETPRVAERFAEVYRATLVQIQENPAGFSPAEDAPRGEAIRYALVGPFSYRVVFAASESLVVVLAIAHLRRKPGYWRRRLRDSI